jgi:predicted nucleic acid-binding protein
VVVEAVQGAEQVTTSTIAYAEVRAAFARKERDGSLDEEGHRLVVDALDAEWRGFTRLAVSNLVSYRAGVLAQLYALRGFDAIHLASAARLLERFQDLRFLTFDDRLKVEARRMMPLYERR